MSHRVYVDASHPRVNASQPRVTKFHPRVAVSNLLDSASHPREYVTYMTLPS